MAFKECSFRLARWLSGYTSSLLSSRGPGLRSQYLYHVLTVPVTSVPRDLTHPTLGRDLYTHKFTCALMHIYLYICIRMPTYTHT